MTTVSIHRLIVQERHARTYLAILGDLQHKIDVYISFGTFGPAPEAYLTNSSQADYLRDHRPDLIPPGTPTQPPSDHSLGTIFEISYFQDPVFRHSYLAWLNSRDE
jgi:hypothetical protein